MHIIFVKSNVCSTDACKFWNLKWCDSVSCFVLLSDVGLLQLERGQGTPVKRSSGKHSNFMRLVYRLNQDIDKEPQQFQLIETKSRVCNAKCDSLTRSFNLLYKINQYTAPNDKRA